MFLSKRDNFYSRCAVVNSGSRVASSTWEVSLYLETKYEAQGDFFRGEGIMFLPKLYIQENKATVLYFRAGAVKFYVFLSLELRSMLN